MPLPRGLRDLCISSSWTTYGRLKNCRTGFLLELRQLLLESPASRMAISTRNTTIAQCVGAVVKFEARGSFGSVSEKIFMAHATRDVTRETFASETPKLRNRVQKILRVCAGLPIALAVTGSAVVLLSSKYGNFETACHGYATRLEKKRGSIGDEDTTEGTSLNAGIILSLEFLQDEFLKRREKIDYCMSDPYISLCVLKNKAWVSVSVLGRLLLLGEDETMDVVQLFSDMSLVTLRSARESSGEVGIVLHDL